MDKTAWIHQVRCTERERAVIDALARREGVKFPDALRRLIREGAKAEGLWYARPIPDDTTHYAVERYDGIHEEETP